MNICVIIPTYNEAKAIAGLIKNIQGLGLEVLVIDDGSTDDTARIAINQAATVLVNQQNEGKGASLRRGFNYALSKNFDAVITMDGDGQHLPEEIAKFIEQASDAAVGIVIGNRMSEVSNMPQVRVRTNRFMSGIISKIAKQDIPDTQCGFRLIKNEVLKKIQLKTSKYETESEILILAARQGFTIKSIPIKSVYSGEKSHINPFIDTLRFIKFIVSTKKTP